MFVIISTSFVTFQELLVKFQIKPYQDTNEKLPLAIDAGISQLMLHVPIRWHVTLENLQQWNIAFSNPNRAQGSLDGGSKEEKVSYPKGSFIERLESVKVKNVLNELPKSSKDKDDLSTEFVFTIDSRKHLINENAIIQISEVNHDKNGNILIEIEFQKVSGPSLYHTEYAVFELHHLNYNKFILELTKDKR